VILARVLAVLAAASLVAAFALATLLPPPLTLAQMVAMLDARLLYDAHEFVANHLSAWLWTHLLLPVLLRPCWLIPAAAGLLFAGAAMTLNSRKGLPRSHRWRS
jgi:uncharacterized protein (DUF2062 family)